MELPQLSQALAEDDVRRFVAWGHPTIVVGFVRRFSTKNVESLASPVEGGLTVSLDVEC